MNTDSYPALGDLVKHEYDRRFTRDNVPFFFDTAPAAPTSVLGRVVDASGTEIAQGSEGSTGGIVVTQTPVSDGDAVNIIVRGPALLNRGAILATDSSGGPLNMATVETKLLALNIVLVDEVKETTTHTT